MSSRSSASLSQARNRTPAAHAVRSEYATSIAKIIGLEAPQLIRDAVVKSVDAFIRTCDLMIMRGARSFDLVFVQTTSPMCFTKRLNWANIRVPSRPPSGWSRNLCW